MDEFNESENAASHQTRLSGKFTIHLLVPIIAFRIFIYSKILHILYNIPGTLSSAFVSEKDFIYIMVYYLIVS